MSFNRKRRATLAVVATGMAAGSAMLSCSQASDVENSGHAAQAATGGAPVGTDPLGTAFFYFRSNSTDWGVDEGSRLQPTSTPNVYSRVVNFTQTFDDSSSVTETIATGPDQWGTSQTYFWTQGQTTFVVPGSKPLVAGSSELNFNVHYPQMGQYLVTFNATTQTLTIGPASQDAGVDAGDAGVDSGVDAGSGGTWQPLANQPTFSADTPFLLTDGRVMVHEAFDGSWWMLTPDSSGSYVHGTWSALAATPAGYGPEYFGSAVLGDGRLIVEGGEYNFGVQDWTTLGAIYDPAANAWTSVSPPSGWTAVGDAPSAVLPNGTFMLGNSLSSQQALFNERALTWSSTGTGKADGNNEEGWTLLPSGKLLTVDVANAGQSELYDPTTGAWTNAGNTIASLVGPGSEMGPAVLMANQIVFAVGGSQHTALYDSRSGAWSVGPDFPAVASGQLDAADAPGVLLPNGHVLVSASPGLFMIDTHFFEFDGATLAEVAKTPNAPERSSFEIRFLPLPTGQILETDNSSDVEIYTPTGSPNPAWAPAITSVPSALTRGQTFLVQGTQLTGLSQATMYGDDVQNATNYPLVRITNNATGHVFFAKTHGFSTYAVATGTASESASFDVPAGAEVGASRLVVVTNGIPSSSVAVNVQ